MVYQGWLFVLLLVIVGCIGSDLRRKRDTQGYRPNNAATAKMYGESDEPNKRSIDEYLGDYVDSDVISIIPTLELPAGALIQRIAIVLGIKLPNEPSLAVDEATNSMSDDSTMESVQEQDESEPDPLNEKMFRGKIENNFVEKLSDNTKYSTCSDCNNCTGSDCNNCSELDCLLPWLGC